MFESIDRQTEADLVAHIDPERLEAHVDALADLTRHSGSDDERAAAEYVVERLESYGVAVERHEYDAYVSNPTDASMTVTVPTRWEVPEDELLTTSFGASTPPSGVHGEVVEVPDPSDDALARTDLVGNLAFTDGLPRPDDVCRLEAMGATGAVFESPTDGHLHEMIVTPVWGTPGVEDAADVPNIPVVEVSQLVGERLRAALTRGPVEATLETAVTTDVLTLPCPVGRIDGRESDRFFVVGNHIDSWHEGATDNATAVAATLELARVFAARDEPPRRGLVFGFWSAHSFGRYAGSSWYADRHFPELRENGVGYVHLDLNGLDGADTLWYQHMAAAEAEHLAVLRDVPDLRMPDDADGSSLLGDDRPGRNSDQSFPGAGLVSVLSGARLPIGTDGGGPVGGGWWWHTPDDTRDKVDVDVLAEETKLYAALAVRICESPILPFDHARSAAAIRDVLAELDAGHPRLTDLESRAETLEAVVERANDLMDERADDPEVARDAEDLQVELANLLVPVLYKSRPNHRHDPALSQGRLPGLDVVEEIADSPKRDRLFAETTLHRRANRIADRLRRATEAADRFVASHDE